MWYKTHNTTQHNTTQHNTTQHNTTQHNTEYPALAQVVEHLTVDVRRISKCHWFESSKQELYK